MSLDPEFVSNFLKANDRDAYYLTLFLPENIRENVQALWAFSADIATVRQRVSEPAPGEIRLQWWNDFLEGTEHGAALSNPIAAGLNAAINRFDLPVGPLRRLVAARRFDLYDDAMRDLHSFEGYAGEVSSILYQFTAMMLMGGNDPGAADASGHLGVAHILISSLYELPQTARRGQILLPWEMYAEKGVTQQDYFGHQPTAQILLVHQDLLKIARAHLENAKQGLSKLPVRARPAFASIATLDYALGELEKFAHLPFAPPPRQSAWRTLAKLAWWNFRNAKTDKPDHD